MSKYVVNKLKGYCCGKQTNACHQKASHKSLREVKMLEKQALKGKLNSQLNRDAPVN